MNILIIHQRFPGQLTQLAPALVQLGHQVVALTMQPTAPSEWQGVRLVAYAPLRGSTAGIHPWLADFETKVVRGEACLSAALALQAEGFEPDLILAHPGWGESLFVKELWPVAKLAIYCEFAYEGDVGFDPEFPSEGPAEAARQRLRGLNKQLHVQLADAGLVSTRWQREAFPEAFGRRIRVVPEGIDTEAVGPKADIRLSFEGQPLSLGKQDEVISFVTRNLEPCEGAHVFMRALPEILQCRPAAHVLIVGGEGAGPQAAGEESWKAIFARELQSRIGAAEWARVHFVGVLAEPQRIALLQLSAVHVHLGYPSLPSLALLEAMSVGCAIVAGATPAVEEALRHDENGRLVDFFDTAALAREVCVLLDEPATRARLGAQARACAQARHDLKTVCLPQQLAWVGDLLAGRDEPNPPLAAAELRHSLGEVIALLAPPVS